MALAWLSAGLAACQLLLLMGNPWPSTASTARTAADYFVHELPGAPLPLVKMHAGHVEITPEHNGNLFFWHFGNQHIADKPRTLIWLNGGPGCSSEDGSMMEIGPYRMKDGNTLQYNNGSWHEFANLLFVDNPVGTGYSYVDTDSYVHELDEMASQFIVFLEKWFALFPQYEHDDIYIAGESYAGQHIPYIAKHILARNKDLAKKGDGGDASKAGHTWNIQGLLIGNGWISPAEQYESYMTFAHEKGLIGKGSDAGLQLDKQWAVCKEALGKDQAGHVDYNKCEDVLQNFLKLTKTKNAEGKDECFNMYDIRLRDVYPSCGMNWPPDLALVTPYLRRTDVTKALHVDAHKNTGWTECSGAVGQAFRASKSKPAVVFMPDILSEIKILLFSGAEDMICNYRGTEAFIGNMEWGGGKGFEITPGNWAPRREWTFEGENAGFWQEARNLTYVLFNNASHMVPFDYPRRTRDMLDRFMGVDISSVGGVAAESKLDGEKQPDTTVSGATNSTASGQAAKDKELTEAKWVAYRKSGELVLVIVAVSAAVWGFFIWRSRRRGRGYDGLALARGRDGEASGLEGFRNKRTPGDVEAGDFDESELDDLHLSTPTEMDGDRYSVGGTDSDDEQAGGARSKPGQSSRS